MSCKDLLVYLDPTAAGTARLEVAVALAESHGAHLKGLPISGQSQHRKAASEAKTIGELFTQRTAAAGISSEWLTTAAGERADALIRHAHCSDLVVVGQPGGGASVPPPGSAADHGGGTAGAGDPLCRAFPRNRQPRARRADGGQGGYPGSAGGARCAAAAERRPAGRPRGGRRRRERGDGREASSAPTCTATCSATACIPFSTGWRRAAIRSPTSC